MEKLTDAIGISLFESEKFGGEKVLRGGICPTLRANKTNAGVIEVMVENKPKRLGNLYGEDKGTGYAGNVWDVENIAPTITTSQGGQREPMMIDRSIVAMRGRNPDNPSDRTVGSPTEQRLEVNTQGTSNCLTSVQKDNMVLIKQATKNGYIECEVGGCFDSSYPESKTRRGRVQNNGNCCLTITAQNQDIVRIEPNYRIRKLTPKECGRLMGVSDEDIDKMAAVNSNTQLYKQFGNSIVVDVMCEMFKNLNINQ